MHHGMLLKSYSEKYSILTPIGSKEMDKQFLHGNLWPTRLIDIKDMEN